MQASMSPGHDILNHRLLNSPTPWPTLKPITHFPPSRYRRSRYSSLHILDLCRWLYFWWFRVSSLAFGDCTHLWPMAHESFLLGLISAVCLWALGGVIVFWECMCVMGWQALSMWVFYGGCWHIGIECRWCSRMRGTRQRNIVGVWMSYFDPSNISNTTFGSLLLQKLPITDSPHFRKHITTPFFLCLFRLHIFRTLLCILCNQRTVAIFTDTHILSMESSLLLEFSFGFLPFLPYFRFAHFLAWLLLLHYYYFVYSTNKYYHKWSRFKSNQI